MSSEKPTKPRPKKPPKPRPDFPLFPHDRGKWAKKINGKLKYFGKWDDPEGALAEYERFLQPPTNPEPNEGTLTLSIADAADIFLTAKDGQVKQGTIAIRTFRDYVRTLNRVVQVLSANRAIESLTPADFWRYQDEFAKTNNPVSVGNEITRIKTWLKWLKATRRIDEIDTGPDFRKPPAKVARRHKRERGKMLFTPEEILAILDESGVRMRAMILLGINCGYHNRDCETLEIATLRDAVRTRCLDNPRTKTEVDRRCPLWPETVEALELWLKRRPAASAKEAFLLHDGRRLSPDNGDVSKRFRTARDLAGVSRGGFSWLRKTFATVASASGDQVAVNFIMGHVDTSIPGVYRQEIQDARLVAVADSVQAWLARTSRKSRP